MRVISIVNIKGGVAKTVSAVNIATLLSQDKKILLVDIDAQSNATRYLDMYEPTAIGSYEVLMDKNLNLEDAIRDTNFPNLQIMSGNIKLALCENEILSDTRKSRETRLKRALDKLEGYYDYVIIDCPPSLGIITTNALVASDYVLVPIKIDKFALDGFGYLLNTIEEIKDEFNPRLNLLGTFITMDKKTKVNAVIKETLKNELGDKLLNTAIRENAAVIQSTFEQIPIVISDKNANAAKDYVSLVEEVLSYV